MLADARDLLQAIGLEDFPFRELRGGALAGRADADFSLRAGLPTAIVAFRRGAGRSTVAALLGGAFATIGLRAAVRQTPSPREAQDILLLDAAERDSLAGAGRALVVLLPDRTSLSLLPSLESFLDEHWSQGAGAALFLINRFDARRDVDREVRAALGARLGARLLPIVIHEDDAGLRAGPHSQIAADAEALAALLAPRPDC